MSVSLWYEEWLLLRSCFTFFDQRREYHGAFNNRSSEILDVDIVWLHGVVVGFDLRMVTRIVLCTDLRVHILGRRLTLHTWVDELPERSLVPAWVIVAWLLRSSHWLAGILPLQKWVSHSHHLLSSWREHLSFLHFYLSNGRLGVLIADKVNECAVHSYNMRFALVLFLIWGFLLNDGVVFLTLNVLSWADLDIYYWGVSRTPFFWNRSLSWCIVNDFSV